MAGGVALLLTSLPAAAEDLLDIYERALDADPALLAARHDHQSVRERLRAAWAELLPVLSFEYQRTRTRQEIRASDNRVFAAGTTTFPVEEWTASAVLPVIHVDNFVRLPQARAEMRRSDFELAEAEQDLIFRVAEAYFGVLAARDNLEYARAEREAIGLQLEEAESRVGAGLSTVEDLYDARARHATALATEADAEDLLADRLRAVEEIIGQAVGELHRLRAEIRLSTPEPADAGAWVEASLEGNPSLAALREAVQVARKETLRVASGHAPTVDLVGSVNRRDTEGSLFGGGSDVETTDLLLRVQVPLFQAPTLFETREAHFQAKRARQDMIREQRRVERETRAAYLGVRTQVARVEALARSVLAQQRALEVKQEGLKAGLNTGLDVLDARRDLFLARRDHDQARYDYILETLRLKRLAGSLDLADLAEVNRLLE